MKIKSVLLALTFVCLPLVAFSEEAIPAFVDFKKDNQAFISIRTRNIEAVQCDADYVYVLTSSCTYRFKPTPDTSGMLTPEVFAGSLLNYLKNGPSKFDDNYAKSLIDKMSNKQESQMVRKLAAFAFYRMHESFEVNEIEIVRL